MIGSLCNILFSARSRLRLSNPFQRGIELDFGIRQLALCGD
jgi:hypothetical protein